MLRCRHKRSFDLPGDDETAISPTSVGGYAVGYYEIDDLKANKKAAARLKHLSDLGHLP